MGKVKFTADQDDSYVKRLLEIPERELELTLEVLRRDLEKSQKVEEMIRLQRMMRYPNRELNYGRSASSCSSRGIQVPTRGLAFNLASTMIRSMKSSTTVAMLYTPASRS